MTMLSPAATYHAELRQELGSVGRALSVQRGLVWLARGLAAGTVVVLGVVIWAWIRGTVASLPIAMLVAAPIAAWPADRPGQPLHPAQHQRAGAPRRSRRAIERALDNRPGAGRAGRGLPACAGPDARRGRAFEAGRPHGSLPAARAEKRVDDGLLRGRHRRDRRPQPQPVAAPRAGVQPGDHHRQGAGAARPAPG